MDIDFKTSKNLMDSPRSLEACRQLGITPESLYYINFKKYLRTNPDIFRLSKDLQKIRFENINKYREEMIETVKEKRNEIIKEQEKQSNLETNSDNNSKQQQKKKKKMEALNLEKMKKKI